MNEIQLNLNDAGRGAFFIERDNKRVAEMVIMIKDKSLTVYHTEVDETLQGKGIGAALFSRMIEYARGQNLKVIPLCQYVLTQLKRHGEQYADIWNKSHS